MAEKVTARPKHGNSYNIFILVLTVFSLVLMAVMIMPLDSATLQLLGIYDTVICIIFLIDFGINLRAAPKKSDYFIKERGWLDLLGSIPSLGISQYGGLLRLARLSRFARIARLLRGEGKKELVRDVVANRSRYALFLAILMVILVLTICGAMVLQFESKSPDANIRTGWDALWYSVVTITTVGYGDRYPVTFFGRITAVFIMFAGVGLIGVLASLLSSLLMGKPPEEEPAGPTVEEELAGVKKELAALRQLLEKNATEGSKELAGK